MQITGHDGGCTMVITVVKKDGKIFLEPQNTEIKTNSFLPFSGADCDYRLYFHIEGDECPVDGLKKTIKGNIDGLIWQVLTIDPNWKEDVIACVIADDINHMRELMLKPQGQTIKFPKSIKPFVAWIDFYK